MFTTNIVDKIITKIALRQYGKHEQKERTIYGIVVGTNSEYDENGEITKVHDIEIVYSLGGQLCNIVVPAENADLECFPFYPGIVVQFCSEQLNSPDIDRKINSTYIMKVDKRLGENFPEEVYEIARMYAAKTVDEKSNLIFWHNLDLLDQEKRKLILKK